MGNNVQMNLLFHQAFLIFQFKDNAAFPFPSSLHFHSIVNFPLKSFQVHGFLISSGEIIEMDGARLMPLRIKNVAYKGVLN